MEMIGCGFILPILQKIRLYFFIIPCIMQTKRPGREKSRGGVFPPKGGEQICLKLVRFYC